MGQPGESECLRSGRRWRDRRAPNDLEMRVLRFVGEQMVVSVVQIARFLTMTVDAAFQMVRELESECWVYGRELQDDRVEWVWLRNAGLNDCGLGVGHWNGSVSSLRGRTAMTEVRLALESRLGGEWISSRVLDPSVRGRWRMLAGVLRVGAEERAAVIVHGLAHSNRLERSFGQLGRRYDVIDCFCSEKAWRWVNVVSERVDAELAVHRLPSELVVEQRRRASRKRTPSGAQREALRLISEQACLREDQLGRFLRLGGRDLGSFMRGLEAGRWVKRVAAFAGEPPGLWLREAGVEEAGTGLAYIKPTSHLLLHRYAVNEVRLEVMRRWPDSCWVCERRLARDAWENGDWKAGNWRGGSWGAAVNGGGTFPDAIVMLGDERYAIEVELTPKTLDELDHVVCEHAERFDRVFYFCSKGVRRLVEQSCCHHSLKQVVVEDAVGLPARERLAAAHRKPVSVDAEEVGVLALLAEQGGIPNDQLMRLLGWDLDRVEASMAALAHRELVRETRYWASESGWWWLRRRGARLSETGLEALQPRRGSTGKLRAFNEARLMLAPSGSGARWIGRRTLQKGARWVSGLPKAVLEVRDGRVAVQVLLGQRWDERYVEYVHQWRGEYDGVIWICRSGVGPKARGVVQEWGWKNVDVRELPELRL